MGDRELRGATEDETFIRQETSKNASSQLGSHG